MSHEFSDLRNTPTMKFSGELLFIHDDGTATRAMFNPKTGVIFDFDEVNTALPDVDNGDLQDMRDEVDR
jgi:hypothetical protein